MEQLIEEFGRALQKMGSGAYALMFFIVVLETIVVIGQFIPTSVLLIFVGFLCFAKVFDFWGMLFAVYIAHLLGEMVNYTLGRTRGRTLFTPESRFFKPRYLEMAEARFSRGGARILLVGQFIGLLRPFLSLAAGITHYPLWWFIPVMTIGCFLWAIVHLSIGYLAGASWQRGIEYLENFSLILLIAIPTALATGWIIKQIFAYAGLMGSLVDSLVVKFRSSRRYQGLAARHPHVFQFLEHRLSLTKPWGLHSSLCIVAGIIGFTICLAILADVRTGDNWRDLDLSLVNLLAQLRTSVADFIFLVITHLGTSVPMWITVVAAAGYCLYVRQQKTAVILLLSVGGSALLSRVLKELYGRERPDHGLQLVEAHGYSFPSSHATVAVALLGALYFWLWSHPGRLRLKASLAFIVLLMSLLIGFSRMYLGVHYPSDVTAGFALGAAVVLVCIPIVSNSKRLVDVPRRADFPVLVVLMLQFGASFAYAWMNPVRPSKVIVTLKPPRNAESIQAIIPEMPRITRMIDGTLSTPVNWVQLGPIDPINARLEELGWKPVRPSDFFTRQINRPLFPVFLEDRPANVTWEKRGAESRLVARFWAPNAEVDGKQVWLGSIVREVRVRRPFDLYTYAIDPDVDRARDDFGSLFKAYREGQIRNYLKRGLYTGEHPFFTHGDSLLMDTLAAAGNAVDTATTQTGL